MLRRIFVEIEYKHMIHRNIELKSESIAQGDDGRVYIEAYAAVFGNVDTYNDVIVKGAFEKTISGNNASRIRLCYQHNMSDVRGKIVDIYEDDYGLRIKAQLSRTQAGKDLAIQLLDGELNELSIGYCVKDSRTENDIRYLTEIDLLECSIVSRAANDKATVISVEKKEELINDVPNLSDEELAALREAVEHEFSKRVLNLMTEKVEEEEDQIDPAEDEEK
jgi:HK97 family phage prohead protease